MSTVSYPPRRARLAQRWTLRLSPRRQLQVFVAIVLAHWVEHLAQAFEVYILAMKVPEARGALGLIWPWLVTSEWLHYAYAVVMLGGLVCLRRHFHGSARMWWTVALALQVWHHLEHLLLLGQVVFSHPLFGAAKPTSIVQLVIPRVELHLFYNTVVFTPMAIAMFLRYSQSRPATVRAGGGRRGDSCSRVAADPAQRTNVVS